MPQQIDELQLKIGSDASAAIRQLGDLSAALGSAASAARGLAGATSFLSNFGSALTRISNTNLDKTISNLDKLAHMDLSNLKDKTIKLDFQVSGADKVERLKYATTQAVRDVQKASSQLARSLNVENMVDAQGAKEVQSLMRGLVKSFSEGKTGYDFADPLFQTIYEHTRKASADVMELRQEYQKFVDWFNNDLKISPSGVEGWESFKAGGFQRILKNGAPTADQIFQGNEEFFRQNFGDLFKNVDFGGNAKDLTQALLDAYKVATDGLQAGTAKTTSKFQEDLFGGITHAIESAKQEYDAAVSKNMVDSANKIPINLDVDQNRFETQIQKAIDAATSRTYSSKPIKFDLDGAAIKQNLEHQISLISVGNLSNFAQDFNTLSNSVAQLNGIRLKDTGIKELANSLSRLMKVDTSKFDTSVFASIATTIQVLSQSGNVSNSLNRFVAALARLANAGDSTAKTAAGLKVLTPELLNTVTVFQAVGSIDETLNSFIGSLSKLATAGSKVDKTAQALPQLTVAVSDFLTAMSQAPVINANVAQTIQGLGNLAQAGSKAGSAMRSLSSGGGGNTVNYFSMLQKAAQTTANAFKKLLSITLNLGKQGVSALGSFFGKLGLIPGYSNGVDNMALSFGNLFRAVVPFYGIRGIFDWVKEAMDIGSSIVEVENVIDTMFGNMGKGYEDISGAAYKWAQTTIDAFGVSELGARQYVGKLMAMFTSSGFDATEGLRNRAAQMSMGLVERAGDIASFYDIDVDDAMTKIQAGIAGMNRPLRSLGVNMSVANLQAFALTKGIDTQWKSLDQATQQWLRYEYIMDATKYSQGDFARTSNTFANQVRLLTLNFQVLSSTIGQGLISAIAPIITWINLLIRKLIQAATVFRTFMFTIFGKPIGAAKGVMNELAGYADETGDSLGAGGSGASDGLSGAADSAKELKKELAVLPFDELNQLSKAKSSTSSGGGSGSGGGGAGGAGGGGWLDDVWLDESDIKGSTLPDAISEWGQKIKNAFNSQNWPKLGSVIADGLNKGINKLNKILDWKNWKDKVEGFIKPFQTTVNTMMSKINWSNLGKALGKGLNTITYTLRSWFKGFDWKSYGTYLAQGMNSLLDEWDAAAFGQMISAKFSSAWGLFAGWVSTFDFAKLGTKIKEALSGFLEDFDFAQMGKSIGTFITGLGTALYNMFSDGTLEDDMGTAITDALKGFFEGFDGEELMKGLKAAGKSILGALGKALKDPEVKKGLEEDFGAIFEGLPWEKILAGAAGLFAAAFATKLIGEALKLAVIGKLSTLFGGGGAVGLTGGAAEATVTTAGAGKAAGGLLGGGLLGGIAALGGAAALFLGSAGYAKKNGATSTDYIKSHGITPNFSVGDADVAPGLAGILKGGKSEISTSITMTPGSQSVINGILGLKETKKTTTTADVKEGPHTPATTQRWNKLVYGSPKQVNVVANATAGNGLHREGDYYLSLANKKPTARLDAVRTNALNKGGKFYNNLVSKSILKTMDGEMTNDFKDGRKLFLKLQSGSIKKTMDGSTTPGFDNAKTAFDSVARSKAMKIVQGQYTDSFNKTKKRYDGWVSNDATKTVYGNITQPFTNAKDEFNGVVDRWATVNVTGHQGQTYLDLMTNYNKLEDDKNIKVNLTKGSKGFGPLRLQSWKNNPLEINSGATFVWDDNAKGGLFTNEAYFQHFGEAGPEAVLPLRNRRSMSMIAGAISKAGGAGGAVNERALAHEIAVALIPLITSNNERPVNVNAVLYTESDEVLARAVQRGNRRLDKRYNPVSQYAYG